MTAICRWDDHLDDLIEDCRKCHAEHEAAVEAAPERLRFSQDRTLRLASEASAEACAYFASLQGWRVTRALFHVRNLKDGRRGTRRDELPGGMWRSDHRGAYSRLFDHADYFCRGAKPIAIVGHPYNDPDNALACAKELGLDAEVLPASWYFPDNTIGVLLVATEPTMAWLGDSPLWAEHGHR